jgi:hypothetical protein
MKRVLILFCAALIFVSVSAGAFAQQNNLAFFMIDSNVDEAGFQGGSLATGIGPDQLVGFTVYVKNTDQLRGFEIDVTWEGAKATWRSTSGPSTESDDINMNGADISLPDEENVLGSVSGLGEVKEDGHYYINYAKLGGNAVATSEYGMLFFVMLKTAATFTTDQDLMVTAAVTALNDGGIKKYLGVRTLYVNGETDVKSSTWGEIKSQFKD